MRLDFVAPVLFALTVSFTGCAADTTAPAPESDPAETTGDAIKSAAKIFACNVDSDCVAVTKAGCCHNGWLEAVNKNETKQYEKLYTPKVCTVMCPMFMVKDERVAECNTGAKKCEMVDVAAIACGGFTRNPHACPTGTVCHFDHVPDIPGKCVAK